MSLTPFFNYSVLSIDDITSVLCPEDLQNYTDLCVNVHYNKLIINETYLCFNYLSEVFYSNIVNLKEIRDCVILH